MRRPDLLLLVAIWEFITAFLTTVVFLVIIVFGFPSAGYTHGLDRFGNIGVLFGLAMLSLTLIIYIGIALTAGIGVLMRKEWGRIFAIVHAAISLLSFPFGTIPGILTLIYVTRSEVRDYFLETKPA